MNSAPDEDRFLTMGEAARIWRVSPDSLRLWARKGKLHPVPTPGGQRRFRQGELTKVLGNPRAAAPGEPSGQRESGRAQTPKGHRRVIGSPSRQRLGSSPEAWNSEVDEAREELEITRARRETEALRREMEQEAREATTRAEAERVRLENEKRFADLKTYAYSLTAWLPIGCRQQVVSLLEDFVNPKNIPSSLPAHEAEALIEAQVRQIRERYDARQAQERKDAIDHERVKHLIQVGRDAAVRSTSSWDSRDAEEARAEVARELARCVAPDWSEANVRRRVDDILGGWEEVDDQSNQDSDEDDGDQSDGEDDDLDQDDEDDDDWDEDEDEDDGAQRPDW